MSKALLRFKARELRGKGESIKVIAKSLQVSVGSVSLWCRDVKLTVEQIRELEIRAHDPRYGQRLSYALAQQKLRLDKTNQLKRKGINEVGELSKNHLFIAGVALYWAEGFKKDSQVGFANTDPVMIQFFLRWIVECCGISMDALTARVTINGSQKHRLTEIQQYWQSITNIPSKNFQKPYLFLTPLKKVYESDTTYFGVLRIKVRKSTDLLRLIHGWIEGLKTNSNSLR